MKKKLKKPGQQIKAAPTVNDPGKNRITDTVMKRCIIAVFIVALIFIVFSPAEKNQFLEWDDNIYITENTLIRDLSPGGLHKIFTTFYGGNYHPLTALTNAIEYYFAGTDPKLYHLVNVAMHALNAILVFMLVLLLSGRIEAGAIASLFFAVHPMHVESVVWASELKDVLYSFFFLLSLIFYLVSLRGTRKPLWHALTIAAFLLSLLSKSAAVILPIALLLMDYYEDRKIQWRLLLEKSHFFILSLLFGLLALKSQEAAGAIHSLNPYGYVGRLLIPLHNIYLYLWKCLVPVNLTAFYPFPVVGLPLPLGYYAAPLILAALAYAVARSRVFRRELIFGTLFFVVNLLLVVQVLSLGPTVAAERYTYVPYIGLFFIIAQAWCSLFDRTAAGFAVARAALLALLIGAVASCAIGSYKRTQVWYSTFTLFDDAVRKGPPSPIPLNKRGVAFYDAGDYPGAINDLTRSIALDNGDFETFLNRGTSKFALKDYRSALDDFYEALKLKPGSATVLVNCGNALAVLGDIDKALEFFTKALAIEPMNGAAHYNYGQLMATRGDTATACSEWRIARDLNFPDAQPVLDRLCR